MKLLYIFPILFTVIFATSCSTDDATDPVNNEIDNLIKIQDITNGPHTLELFNTSGTFKTGYNKITLRIKENATGSYVEEATISWMPTMQMHNMAHSAPKSKIVKAEGTATLYNGFIVYQMTNPDGSGWTLDIDYTIDGKDYSTRSEIVVAQHDLQNVISFQGSDDANYVLALIEPKAPKMAVNLMTVGLFKMDSMTSFPVVEDYEIKLDPRMPGMGNHSSPNNSDLNFDASDAIYHGKLSLTMTGYWVLNLQLVNSEGELIKGEEVTEDQPKSSLYLELEF